jgi:hypothetical protein
MDDLDEVISPKSPTYSQAGTIADPSLNGLRDQIKKIMIPMLIKIFQLKVELNQSISLPSRLQATQKESPDTTLEELKKLDEDLKLLILWCHSCRNQIAKALSIPEEEQKEKTTTMADPDPVISKSFSDVVSAQPPLFKVDPLEPLPVPSVTASKPKWWQKFIK